MLTQKNGKTTVYSLFSFLILILVSTITMFSCAPSKPMTETAAPAAIEEPQLSLEEQRLKMAEGLNAALTGAARYVVSKPNFCLVLNPDPTWYDQPEWTGGCDENGFASGEGILTWSYKDANLAGRSAMFSGRLDKGAMGEGKIEGFSVDAQRLEAFREDQRLEAMGEKELEASRLIKSKPPQKQERLELAGSLNQTLTGKGKWMVDEMNYCLVWNPNPVSVEMDSKYRQDYVTWLGKCDEDGYASGYGVLTWYYGDENVAEDEETGTMEKGNFVGPFKAVYVIGDGATASTYKGQVIIDPETGGGMMHGRGLYTWASGDYYEGEYKNNKRDGYGKMVFKNPPRPTMAGYWKDDQFVQAAAPPETGAGACAAEFLLEIPGYPDSSETVYEYRCLGINEGKSVGCKQVVMIDGTRGWECGDAMTTDRQQTADAACGCY